MAITKYRVSLLRQLIKIGLLAAVLLATLAVVTSTSGLAEAQEFTFANLTDRADGPGQGSFPSINDGGDVSFRKGYGNSIRLCLHETLSWEEAKFRCLHLCFLQRSSIQKKRRGQFLPRPNPADIMTRSLAQRILSSLRGLFGIPEQGKAEWKIEKFTRGELVEKDVSAFFPSSEQGGR